MITTDHNTNTKDRVLKARAYMLASQRPVYLFGNLLVMLITGAALWSAAPPTLILIWCISGALLTLLRVLDWRKFQRQRPEQPAQISNWLQQFMFFTAVGGIIWGVGGFWFIDPVEPQRMIFLITVFLGIGTASIPALCLHFAGFAAFVIPMFLPLILKLTLSGQPFLAVLASLLFCYLIVILFFGRNLNAAITTSITLELENALLLEQVTVAKEQAELANVEKSRFLASVSHDVRQPLYAMGLFLGSLERNDLSVRNGELIRDIENAYSALEDMCQALLEISRLDAGAVEPNVVSISLSELVQRLVPDAQRGSDDKALEFHYQLEQSICVRSDPILLERILRNLLSNAVKYTDSGFVSIEAEKVEQNMVVTISDSGHGISSDDYEKVFDEYQQLENPERDRTKGLGLGLSVVRRMCDLLQHSIRVDSVIGKGSKFSVTVPLGDPNSIVQPTIEEYQNDITGLHIGIIDDEEQIRKGMNSLLTGAGAMVSTAVDSTQLLAEISKITRPLDLIICDYRLRDGKSGFSEIEAVRSATDSELPALIMTGDTQAQFREQAEKSGLYILHKPIKITHLLNIVGELV